MAGETAIFLNQKSSIFSSQIKYSTLMIAQMVESGAICFFYAEKGFIAVYLCEKANDVIFRKPGSDELNDAALYNRS